MLALFFYIFYLCESDASKQIAESRIAAHRIEIGVHLEELHHRRLFLIGMLQPLEYSIVFTQRQLWDDKRSCRYIAFFSALIQFVDKMECIVSPSGPCVRRRQQPDGARATIHHQNSFIKNGNSLVRSAGGV